MSTERERLAGFLDRIVRETKRPDDRVWPFDDIEVAVLARAAALLRASSAEPREPGEANLKLARALRVAADSVSPFRAQGLMQMAADVLERPQADAVGQAEVKAVRRERDILLEAMERIAVRGYIGASHVAHEALRALSASPSPSPSEQTEERNVQMINGFPRRQTLDLMTPAECAIYEAVQAVEEAGADERLTRAVILLQDARNLVADYVESSHVG